MKVAWFQGDAQEPNWEAVEATPSLSQDDLIAAAVDRLPLAPLLRVLLVPNDFDLRLLGGDDWDDAPAGCNAGEPSRGLPTGSFWLTMRLGDRWPS